MITMKDGKQLTADIYRLDGAVPKPVIVVLTPYDKDQIVIPGDIFNILLQHFIMPHAHPHWSCQSLKD
jgi:predicted acyl esterase